MIAIVALGTWSIVVLWGVTEGFFKTMIDAQVQLDVGSLQIHNASYLDDPAIENEIDSQSLEAIQDDLDAMGLNTYTPRINVEGLLKSAYGATGVEFRGVDPATERNVTTLQNALVDGEYISSASQIMLGKRLADALDVRIGENVVVQVQGVDRPQAKGFNVVGLLSSGLSNIDRESAYITLDAARALVGQEGVTEIAILLNQGTNEQIIKAQLEQRLGSQFTVSSLFDLNTLLRDLIKINYIEMIPIMLILSLLAGFGVANTVMFTVLERTREFGVMMAVGLKPKKLSRLILLESILTSLLGFGMGALIGYGFVWYLSVYGINFSYFTEVFPDLGMPHIVYAVTSGWYWMYGLTVVFLTALVAAWYPARKATALDPMEAIRHV